MYKIIICIMLAAGIDTGQLIGGTQMNNAESVSDVTGKEAVSASVTFIRGWYSGDPDALDGVIQNGLAKRGLVVHPKTNEKVITHMGKDDFIESARQGGSRLADGEWDILSADLLDLTDGIATVKVTSTYLVDVCQVAFVDGRWQVVNVLWVTRGTPPWWTK